MLNSPCTTSRLSLFLTVPSQGAGWGGKRLRGDTARTTDLNWARGHPIPCDIMLSNKIWRQSFQSHHGLVTGWVLVHCWWVTLALLVFFLFSLHLLKYLYVNSWVFPYEFFLLPFQFFSSACLGRVSEWLAGVFTDGWSQPTTGTTFKRAFLMPHLCLSYQGNTQIWAKILKNTFLNSKIIKYEVLINISNIYMLNVYWYSYVHLKELFHFKVGETPEFLETKKKIQNSDGFGHLKQFLKDSKCIIYSKYSCRLRNTDSDENLKLN